jgi:hypothetical protein
MSSLLMILSHQRTWKMYLFGKYDFLKNCLLHCLCIDKHAFSYTYTSPIHKYYWMHHMYIEVNLILFEHIGKHGMMSGKEHQIWYEFAPFLLFKGNIIFNLLFTCISKQLYIWGMERR